MSSSAYHLLPSSPSPSSSRDVVDDDVEQRGGGGGGGGDHRRRRRRQQRRPAATASKSTPSPSSSSSPTASSTSLRNTARLLHETLRQSPVNVIVLLLLAACVSAQVWVITYTGKIVGGFYTATTTRDRDLFFHVLWFSSAVTVGSAMLESAITFFADLFAWLVRKTLSVRVHRLYFREMLYYRCLAHVDNPDQRIVRDIDNFGQALAALLKMVVSAPVTVVFYFVKTALYVSWYTPLLLSAYFVVGYVVNRLVMSPIINLVFQKERLEGNFRFKHVQVRSYAETIAILKGQTAEYLHTDAALLSVLRVSLRLVFWQLLLLSISNVFTYMGSILYNVVVGLPVMFIGDWQHYRCAAPLTGVDGGGGVGDVGDDGAPCHIDVQWVSEAGFYCISLVSGYSAFINSSTQISKTAAFAARVVHLLDTLERLARHSSGMSAAQRLYDERAHNERPTNNDDNDNDNDNATDDDDDDDNDDNDDSDANNNNNNASSRSLLTVNGDNSSSPSPSPSPSSTLGYGAASTLQQKKRSIVVGPHLSFHNVTARTPDLRRVLFRNLSFTVRPGESLLIMGQNGVGKSSIFRLFTFLWTENFTGKIVTLPQTSSRSLMFLPQKPYLLTDGTLADQIVYPHVAESLVRARSNHSDDNARGRNRRRRSLASYLTDTDLDIKSSTKNTDLDNDVDDHCRGRGDGDGALSSSKRAPDALSPGELRSLLSLVGLSYLLDDDDREDENDVDNDAGDVHIDVDGDGDRDHDDHDDHDDNIDRESSIEGALDMSVPKSLADTLSPGEQQLLSFARLLYHRPQFVLLDEATSALSLDNERKMYSLLADAGMSYVSIGHRETLLRYHQQLLRLVTKNEWKLSRIDASDGVGRAGDV